MIEPRASRLRICVTNAGILKNLPTGKDFGGSSLSKSQPQQLVFSIATSAESVSNNMLPGSILQSGGYCASKRDPIGNEPQSPLVIEAGRILVIAIWLWCLVGANFCFNSLSTIVSHCVQDV